MHGPARADTSNVTSTTSNAFRTTRRCSGGTTRAGEKASATIRNAADTITAADGVITTTFRLRLKNTIDHHYAPGEPTAEYDGFEFAFAVSGEGFGIWVAVRAAK